MREPFLKMRHVGPQSDDALLASAVPHSFFSGAPCLLVFWSCKNSVSEYGKCFCPANNLVRLTLWDNPHSG